MRSDGTRYVRKEQTGEPTTNPKHFGTVAKAGSNRSVQTLNQDVGARDDWRSQEACVEGRVFTYTDVHGGRMFHGSRYLLDDNTVLSPGSADTNFKESSSDAVSITSGADIAYHWARESAFNTEPFYVYEIEPVGPIEQWRAMVSNFGQNFRLQEGRVQSARILRRVDLDDARSYEGALARGEDPLYRTNGATT